jgi:transposase InsO family protein
MNDMRIISVSRKIIHSASTWAQSGIPISLFCIWMIAPRCAEPGHTAYAPAEGSCQAETSPKTVAQRRLLIRLRPEYRNHVWSYDFVEAHTHDGRSLRVLTVIDEFTRQCLAIRVSRRLNNAHVIEVLADSMLLHGVPEHVRSDNGAEMTARRVRNWLATVGTQPLFIEPGSPWENGYCESFNGKLRDE